MVLVWISLKRTYIYIVELGLKPFKCAVCAGSQIFENAAESKDNIGIVFGCDYI